MSAAAKCRRERRRPLQTGMVNPRKGGRRGGGGRLFTGSAHRLASRGGQSGGGDVAADTHAAVGGRWGRWGGFPHLHGANYMSSIPTCLSSHATDWSLSEKKLINIYKYRYIDI